MSTTEASPRTGTADTRTRLPPAASGFAIAAAVLVAMAAVHLTQGSSSVGAGDLVRVLTGHGDGTAIAVLTDARLPRLAAAALVGIALGASGALLQSIARNALASPDTLAVTGGAYLAVAAVAAFGISLPVLSGVGVAFAGAAAASALVLAVSAGGGTSTARLILAGTAVTLAAESLVYLLFILFQENTISLFAWGGGSLSISGFGPLIQTAPVVGLALVGAVLIGGKLDVLRLGDDTAASLGVAVGRTRLTAVVCALLMAAGAVAVAGPIGFVGLAAPVIARLIAGRVPALLAHRLLIPFSAMCGAIVLIGADITVRALLGGAAGYLIPVGTTTTILGAGVMVWLARRAVDAGTAGRPATLRGAASRTRAGFALICAALASLLAAALVAGMLSGDTMLLGGDIWNWLNGRTGRAYTWIIEQRYPRVLAAVLAGAALAAAGAVIQGVCRNPLAEPGILGVTGGAGVGAVAIITWVPAAGPWTVTAFAAGGAVAAFAIVYGLAWKGGLDTARLVLIGIGVSAIASAVIMLLIIYSDPWNLPKAMTWLSGSTYGRTAGRLVPVAAALVVLVPFIAAHRREMDLLALDDDTPRTLGVRLERSRLGLLAAGVLLTASAVAVVGVVSFVGLVAPHLARALVGSRSSRVLPTAMLLGGVLVSAADTVGRTVIAPAQIPAGLVCALIGTPYFIWILWRTRRPAAP